MMRHHGVALVCALLLATGCRDGATAKAQPSEATLEYVAHACFRITSSGGTTVMLDPYESRWWLGYDFPEGLPEVQAVLITHPHSDHDGGLAAGEVVPWDETTPAVNEPGTYRFGDIDVVGIPGKHADPYGKEFGQINTLWVLEVDGLRIVHVGDNGPLQDAIAEQLEPVDILMLPIDSEYHILSHEEIETYRERLSPAIVIPMHYRHDDLEVDPESPDDLGPIDGWLDEQTDVQRLPGNTFRLSADGLPDTAQVLVFRHSTAVTPPRQ